MAGTRAEKPNSTPPIRGYPRDCFGDVRPVGENTHVTDPNVTRGVSVAEYRQFARNSSNETIFKNGLHLLDDVDAIYARPAAERDRVIEVFRRHGYEELPDGRKVEKIVEVAK